MERGTESHHYLIGHLGTKQPTRSSRADGPRIHIFWIRPNQVTEGAFMRNFLITFNGSNLIECLDVWRQASVHTENLLIY